MNEAGRRDEDVDRRAYDIGAACGAMMFLATIEILAGNCRRAVALMIYRGCIRWTLEQIYAAEAL